MRATCRVHLIILDFITLIKSDEERELQSSCLCNYFQPATFQLRHYDTSPKVAGSRFDDVNVSIYLNHSIALGPDVYSASNRND
jgi:hypothetical protein